MAIDKHLLDLLVCPENREKLSPVSTAMVAKLNEAAQGGELKNRAGRVVECTFSGGLVRADGRFVYPVIEDIPNLLVDEAIPLDQLE